MTTNTAAGPSEADGIGAKLKALGPALLLAAVVVGPGSIALNTIAGSLYGYELLWVPVVATAFMILYAWLATRIGLITGGTLFDATRKKYGPNVAKAGGVFGFATILSFQAGNNAGIGFASNALFGYDMLLWAAVFTALAIGFIWLPDLYDKVEWLVRAVVAIMIVAFFGTLAIVGFDVRAAGSGLIPGVPDVDGLLLALGIAATTFSIAAAVYQTHLMQEKDWGTDRLADGIFDTFLGIGILGVLAVSIMLTSASVIFGKTEPVFSAAGMAQQLEPLAGPAAFYLFTVGFFFASLSSLVVNALIGATLLADGFDRNPSMDGRVVKQWSTVAMLFGLAVVLVFNEGPIELLRIAQAFAVVAFPLLAFLVVSISADSKMMGDHANGIGVNVVAGVGYLVIVGIVLNYLYEVVQFI